jgi:cobalt/nickel transport system permease protein
MPSAPARRADAALAATLAVIAAGLCIPIRFWPVHVCLICVVFAAQTIARIPLSAVLHRLAEFLPFILMLSLAGLSRGEWEPSVAILLQSVLSLMAAIWLAHVAKFDRILQTLRSWGLPAVGIALLDFMHRYLYVVSQELHRMRQAQAARSFGRVRIWSAWLSSAQLLGALLLRAFSRAERVHSAMCARGWDGQVRLLDEATGARD